MIKRFKVHNFKNLINLEFRPAVLNLLIGQNNAGKTNLCQALHFFALASRMSLKEAAQQVVGEVWNLTNAYQDNRFIDFELEASIVVDNQTRDFTYLLSLEAETHAVTGLQMLKVANERLTLAVEGGSRTLIGNQFGQAELQDETKAGRETLHARIPEGYSALCKLFDEQAHRLSLIFRQYLAHWAYFNLSPPALRSSRVTGPFPLLTPAGENLGHFLFTLHNQMPALTRSLLGALRRIEPKAEFFAFSHPDPEHLIWFLADRQGRRFGVQHLSDGTLRYLAICCIILGLERAPDFFHPPPLVMLEEPENGLHVNELKPLLNRIDRSGKAGQFVFTSHNQYFIDLFDKDLEGLHLLKPGPVAAEMVQPDPAKVRPLLEDMPLGELHFHELLT